MSKFNNWKIVQKDMFTTHVTVDGLQIEGVTSIEYKHNVGDHAPTISIVLMPKTVDLEIADPTVEGWIKDA